jgi:predicted patatin/cPLA2 family phospholipase
VCEGGGQRGIFTAGVLDEFMRAQFNPFDLYFGTSAGAQNLSAYVCNQPGYARKVIMRYTTAKEFFNPVRFVRGGNLIDLDWLVESTSSQMPLAMDTPPVCLIAVKSSGCAPAGAMTIRRAIFPQKRTGWTSSAPPARFPAFIAPAPCWTALAIWTGISDAVPVQEAARAGRKPLW